MLEGYENQDFIECRPQTIDFANNVRSTFTSSKRKRRNISLAQTEFQLVNKIDQFINENESQAMEIMKKNNDLQTSKQMLKNYFRDN